MLHRRKIMRAVPVSTVNDDGLNRGLFGCYLCDELGTPALLVDSSKLVTGTPARDLVAATSGNGPGGSDSTGKLDGCRDFGNFVVPRNFFFWDGANFWNFEGQAWTVALWVRPAAYDWFESHASLIGCWNDQTGATQWRIRLHGISAGADPTVYFDINDDGVTTTAASAAPITQEVWHLIVITYDGVSDMQMWIDGAGFVDQSSGIDTDGGLQFRIGGSTGDAGGLAQSYGLSALDHIALWTRVLDPADVTLLWNGGAGQRFYTTNFPFGFRV
jgi:hypothetical protein